MKILAWRRKSRKKDLEDEIDSHLTMAACDRIERGEKADQALARSRREFGNVGLGKEVAGEIWGWSSIERLGQDLRYASRILMKNPGFAITALLTIALGVGTTTTMFSVLNTYLIHPLPFPEPRQLVQIYRTSIHSQS